MPVSAVAVPSARRASAAFACCSVKSRSTCRKAVRSLFSMRSRNSSASSAAEISLACSSAESSLRVLVCMVMSVYMAQGAGRECAVGLDLVRVLFDHLGHQVETVLRGRGDLLVVVAAVRLAGNVVAQAQRQRGLGCGDRVVQRRDAGGVDGAQFLDQREDAIELVQRTGGF